MYIFPNKHRNMTNHEGKHLYGIDDPWDASIFDALARVNGCLHRTGMPEAASRLLEEMQECICSGDGRTPVTAFKAASPKVMDRVLSLLVGEGTVSGEEFVGGSIRVILGGDGFPVRDIWFKTTETVTE